MKGLSGIVIAAALGIVGAFCNWLYISRLAHNYQEVEFVAIDPGTQIKLGDRFRESHFKKVPIPQRNVGNLADVAVLWQDRHAVVGYAATKDYRGVEILLRQDLKTPGRRDLSEMLGENEVARWVPVDSSTFVPEKVNPGDYVSFIVPRLPSGQPPKTVGSKGLQAEQTEVIGPFRILALGTRTGRRDVRRAAGLSSGPEHVITISVGFENERMEERAERLFTALRLTGNRGAQVMLHPVKKTE